MKDERAAKLARLLVEYSCEVGEGDHLQIELIDTPTWFGQELIRAAQARGAHVHLKVRQQPLQRLLVGGGNDEQLRVQAENDAALMRQMQAYIGVRGADNVSEMADVPQERMRAYETLYLKPVHFDLRVRQTRWCILRWPTPSMAQLAEMSTDAFEDFFFRVCTMDYPRMSRAMRPLVELMEKTDRVRLVAPGTDLRFSIRDIPAVPCDGKMNIPDGEVFTAPVIDSVEGRIAFNAPTIYQGKTHERVTLAFERGRIVHAEGSDTGHLESVLDSDQGARSVGEFAIGFNPHVRRPMKDILFDEKIAGSIHFTPGQAYEEADNGNRSQVHWDLVLMMDEKHGGGEIWFDDVLVRRDGEFVPEALRGLNPDALTA